MKALIFENKVIQIEKKQFPISSDLTWIDASDECEVGWTLKDGALIAPAPLAEKTYVEKRLSQFPSIGDQLDMQYWDQVNGTTTWKEAIAKVKADHPKP